MITTILSFIENAGIYILQTLYADGIYLLVSMLVASAITVYIGAQRTRALFLRFPRYMIGGSVAFGTFTPLCACGTMAVVISFISTALPWGPLMAFLVSSPLMSPDTFILFSGILGLKFTIGLTIISILLGLGAGYLCHWIETRTTFLDRQFKARKHETNSCSCRNYRKPQGIFRKLKARELSESFLKTGLMKILPLFIFFILIAYIVKEFIPTNWIIAVFSGDHFYSVPLAALIGLPLYVSDAAIAPLLQVLRDAGASDGAIMAFMITGPATSIGVIGGLTLILRRRAIMLYLGIILVGGILAGVGYNLI